MKLKLMERARIFAILPEQGTILTLRATTRLRAELAFTDEEKLKYGIREEASPQEGVTILVVAPENKDVETEIAITTADRDMIGKRLLAMSAAGKLDITFVPLFEKFVDE